MSKSSGAAIQVGALINKGKFWRALRLAQELANSGRTVHDANFWFNYGLAVRLTTVLSMRSATGRTEILDQVYQNMRSCDNFTGIMDGDWLRDNALDAIRQGQPDQAEEILTEVLKLHSGNPNRTTELVALQARIVYERGDYAAAAQLHRKAYAAWTELGAQADPQWIMNNTRHWFRAERRRYTLVAGLNDKTVNSLYAQVWKDNPPILQRTVAALILWTGGFGCWIEDQLRR